MTSRCLRFLAVLSLLASAACAAPPMPHEPDVVDVTLSASADHVRTAVIQVLADGGYEVEQEDDQNLTTGYREEVSGLWDWLLRRRFGRGWSRVESMVTPASKQRCRHRLNVLYEGNRGIFTR